MKKNNEPKILFLDVETKPVKVWAWRTGEQYVTHDHIVEGEKFDLICIAWKWAHEKRVTCLDWGRAQDSSKMVDALAKEVEKADVVIGQNSDVFDVKQINLQRMLHKQAPIAWPTLEDIRKQVRAAFYVTSSSLEYMSKLLTGSGKSKMQFSDWVAIVDKRDAKALAKMKRYCKRDVLKTQAVWERIRPYVKAKAHRGIIAGKSKGSCPSCGSVDSMKYGWAYSAKGKRQRYVCRSCAHKFS